MKTNKIELKDFFDYCLSVLDMVTEENEMMNIKFSYENSKLIMKTTNNKSFSTDYVDCSIEDYEKVINKINTSFISNHKINSIKVRDSKDKNICQITNGYITITCDIFNEEHLNNTKLLINKSRNKKIIPENNISNFQKMTNLYRIYKIFLKRCLNKDYNYQIYPIYNNGILSIKINNIDGTVFYHKIKCDEHQANTLIRRICEDFVFNCKLKSSEIKPITNNQEYLQKMIQSCKINHFYVAKDDKFSLIVPFDINNPYYLNLNNKALELSNPKTLKLFYDSKISSK